MKDADPDAYRAYLDRKNAIRRKGRPPKIVGDLDSRSPEARAIYKRRYLDRSPTRVKEQRAKAYRTNREKEREDHLRWSRRPDVAKRRRAELKAYYDANPARYLERIAKDLLARTLGVSRRRLPPSLVDAEVARLKLGKLLREMSAK